MDYIEGTHRDQTVLFPEFLDEYVAGENPVRVIEAFVESLDLRALGFTHFCRDLDLFSRDLVAIDGSLSPKGASSRQSIPSRHGAPGGAISPTVSCSRP
jgi:transposase